MEFVAENLWLLRFPLQVMGAQIGRNVSIIRLESGKLVIHSSAPFSETDIAAICKLGKPGWLIDVMTHHDTFSAEGQRAFPDIPYLVPEGMNVKASDALLPLPAEWKGQLEVARLEGTGGMEEHACFHRASRTLIVADLLFNFRSDQPLWSRLLERVVSIGGVKPAVARTLKMSLADREAFRQSMRALLAWDFDRVIVGHGEVVEALGRRKLRAALDRAGLAPAA